MRTKKRLKIKERPKGVKKIFFNHFLMDDCKFLFFILENIEVNRLNFQYEPFFASFFEEFVGLKQIHYFALG